MNTCVLCDELGGQLIFANDFVRVINANEVDYPAFTRVVLQQHHKEMSDLSEQSRQDLMDYVYCVETVMREVFQPDKINLATLGNMVAHVHWHIIARFRWDRHFPNPIWASPVRSASEPQLQAHLAQQNALLARYYDDLIPALRALSALKNNSFSK